jgi:hypothetical protein
MLLIQMRIIVLELQTLLHLYQILHLRVVVTSIKLLGAMLNEYMFFSSKGGASKTTFARLTAEYLNQINQIM